MKKKKVIVTILVIVGLLAAAAFYLNYRNRTLSPPGEASLTNGDLKVSVTYSRPSVRGRLIFGEESQNALQPYGKYWRLGANESTEITFSRDVTFNGQAVKQGTYRMYAVPGRDSFQIGLNSELDKWGYSEPDYSLDVLKTSVPVTSNSPVEQHTISLVKAEDGVNVVIEWSDVKLEIPVRPS
jgi:hypothetical protein